MSSLLLTLPNSQPVFAAPDWRLTPTLNLTQSFTDNFRLNTSDGSSEFITEITPGATLTRQGNRVNLALNYQMQYVDYLSTLTSDQVNHRLSLSSESEIIEDSLFLDANARYTQQLIDRRSANTGDNLLDPGNFTDTWVFDLQPSWRRRLDTPLGAKTTVGIDTTVNTVGYNNLGDDSSGYGIRAFVETAAGKTPFSWSISAEHRRADPDRSLTQQTETYDATIGYRISPKTEGRLRYGYVDNHLDDPTDEDAGVGDFWGAQLLLHPNARTTLDINYNSRLLGTNDRGFTLTHRRRHTTWSLRHSESVSSTRQEFLQFTPAGALICPAGDDFLLSECRLVESGEAVLPGPDEQVFVVGAPLPTLREDRFIQESTNANLVIKVSKTTLNLGLFQRDRELQQQVSKERDSGTNIAWTLRLSGRTKTTVQFTWTRIETLGLPTDYQRAVVFIGTKKLTPESGLSLTIRHNERDSSDPRRAFSENRVAIAYNRTF
ncbi:TIGR03016 family PEP-CTERM system-associated outer membrane protein [Motiliproteus sp. SC1-56]|uniref:TIGR03016 family PEP-CTERM system-associated outer membrane protein n=1 Tax=Motiliproteus sp. SC1-56 TaxID=2799565 RepID=UPI001A902C2C|nr:TIGR03016 family PEP-CTERM system-associated outer membrane protein [Motiliproteus sp. SC1-56]